MLGHYPCIWPSRGLYKQIEFDEYLLALLSIEFPIGWLKCDDEFMKSTLRRNEKAIDWKDVTCKEHWRQSTGFRAIKLFTQPSPVWVYVGTQALLLRALSTVQNQHVLLY